MRVLEARAGQAEVVQPVVQSDTGHRDAQAAHRGEVRQPQAARLVHLAEHDVAVLAVDGAPRADASLQGAPHAACQAGMPSQHLLQHGHRSNRWRGLQKWNDLGIGDLGQGVWRVGKATYTCALNLVTHDDQLTPKNVRAWLSIHEEIVHTTIEIHALRSDVKPLSAPGAGLVTFPRVFFRQCSWCAGWASASSASDWQRVCRLRSVGPESR